MISVLFSFRFHFAQFSIQDSPKLILFCSSLNVPSLSAENALAKPLPNFALQEPARNA